MDGTRASDLVEHRSAHAFAKTLERIARAITTHGMTEFARIDHAANASAVGLRMPAATVVIFGSPAGGTPVMLAVPEAAFELPLRVLVREQEDGAVLVSFRPIVAALAQVGVPKAIAERLQPAQEMLLAAVSP